MNDPCCPQQPPSAPRRIGIGAARQLLASQRTLLLDARRAEALESGATGIPGAVPLVIAPARQRLPDTDRDRPILVYCLCSGEASSMRAALWLIRAGYRNVSVLRGGLPAWIAAGQPTEPIVHARAHALRWMPIDERAGGEEAATQIAARVFLDGGEAPVQRDVAVVFVDMVDSTALLFRHAPTRILELVQSFMHEVVDTAVLHCGDVHDFEGDGAMLYFAGVGEALPAVFDLRTRLDRQRLRQPALPQARFAITTGPVVIGYVGTRVRRSVSFIGPCINAAARILRLAEPGGIAATAEVVEQARRVTPELASAFAALPHTQHLKGWQAPVTIFQAPPQT
ncbi:MAG: rhodanese-like domain-containing protein [Nevskiales bacterium]|nr:rhodanese-like domain-containing protein [Nevskiales bacterium]